MTKTTESGTEEVANNGWWSRRKRWQKVALINWVVLFGVSFLAFLGSDTGGNAEPALSTPTSSAVSSPTTTPQSTPTTAAPATTAAPTPTAVPALAGIGDPVRDGKFEFVIQSVESPGSFYSPENVLDDEAIGVWFIVYMTVTNIGDEPQSFFAGNQNLIWNGRKLEAADFTWNGTSYEDLNPGITLDAILLFDVPDAFPEDGSGTVLRLHDSASSGGVEVAL